jgi:Tol biopolymer transport system component
MSVEGGPPETICDTGSGLPRGGTWSKDGLIVYALAGGPLLRVDSRGGKPVPALPLDASRSERGQRHPWFLPDGKHLLYLSRCDDPDQDGIYVASLDGGRPRRLSNALSNAFYSPPGFLLFGENDSVRGQRFDVNKLELVGSPFTIAANAAIATSLHFVHAGISDNGVVVYCVGAASPPELAWVDREGLRSAPIAEGLFPAIAADGKRVACEQWSKDSSADQIWILDPDRGATRLTNARQWSQNPIWSRDGRFVAYRRGTVLLRRLADGTAAEQVIGQIPLETNLSDWTSDGRYIVGHSFEGATKSDILIFPAAGGAPVKIAASPFSETWGKVSPDGHWLAFQSDDTGRYEVYVQQFDPSGAPRQKLQVSRSGGNLPHWSPDGKSLVWADSAGTFFTSTITFGPELRTSPPKPLFDTQYPGMFFDLGPDGRILVTAAPFHPGNSIGVVVNWPGLVKEND